MKTAKQLKSTKPDKHARRAHRQERDRRRPPVDDAIAGLEALLGSMRLPDPSAPWTQVAPTILPVLKRLRMPFAPMGEPLYLTVPPGIRTGFGIDLGPALSHVDRSMVEHWGVSDATLLAVALDNLATLAQREPPQVDQLHAEGIAITAIQAAGWGSALILAPDLLRPLLGPTPQLVMTPVRNTLVAVPSTTPFDDVEALHFAFADGASDALDAGLLRWTGLVVVDPRDRAVGLPN
jgi:hypothetical protein